MKKEKLILLITGLLLLIMCNLKVSAQTTTKKKTIYEDEKTSITQTEVFTVEKNPAREDSIRVFKNLKDKYENYSNSLKKLKLKNDSLNKEMVALKIKADSILSKDIKNSTYNEIKRIKTFVEKLETETLNQNNLQKLIIKNFNLTENRLKALELRLTSLIKYINNH